jgi:hypothetical protein
MFKTSIRSSILATLLLSFCAVPPARAGAADAKTPLAEGEVTVEKLKEVFDNAFFTTEIDKDGDLKITEGGVKTFVRVDKERKLISLFCLWGLKANAGEIDKLRFINRLNDKLILARFCMPDPTTLWCDYQMSFNGGVSPATIVNAYRQFVNVVKGGISSMDDDDVVGSN